MGWGCIDGWSSETPQIDDGFLSQQRWKIHEALNFIAYKT